MIKIAMLLAALLPAGAGAADMYLRGGFNGWGIDNLLVAKGGGIYETRLTLSPGNHPFKVGSSDWSAEWTIAPAPGTTVAPGRDYRMLAQPGREGFLFVRQSADYVFRVDLADPAAPQLRVTRIGAAPVAATDPHQGHGAFASLAFATFNGKRETARFSTPDATAALRSYAQSTSMQLRDPGPQYVNYAERADLPTVRSGSLAFDALFALAASEMRQNAVREIKDGNYNQGQPVPCECFETGEKWHYVWTRDLSYAADLGLAMLDPQRVMQSLDFKLSPLRPALAKAAQVAGSKDGLQIIQDTGSGGSWPVSTDRVSWAFGAEQVLKMLAPAQRKPFAARAYKALSNTIANDRLAAFDPLTGLYGGEQSFLDWRDQSYAAWIVDDLASLASAKALSTNVGHYKALTLAASLAREHGEARAAARYAAWAGALKRAINRYFWLEQENLYSSLGAAHFDGAPLHKFDWLGQSLAIVTGVADPARARKILAHYPHGPMGAPVIYPQQQGVPVYHNRAIWPFVTAYGLKAAAQSGNVSVADAAYDTLMRGAALNLSNMENLEWLSGQPLLLDENQPALIGPIINSKRQLWSVGAYLGMVIENVFGISATAHGIAIAPFVTARLRREAFGGSDRIVLDGLRLKGKRLKVTLRLPEASVANGYYPVSAVTVDGARAGTTIAWNKLADGSSIEVRLGALRTGQQQLRRVSADPYTESSAVFAPADPDAPALDGKGKISFGPARAGVLYNIYRDGRQVAAGLAAGTWLDPHAPAHACYALEAQYKASGNRSHHSVPVCAGAAIEVAADFPRWGAPKDTLSVAAIAIPAAGKYQVQLRYANRANQINLGISGGVKWLSLADADGRVVAAGVVQLPHTQRAFAYSTPLAAQLQAGRVTAQLSDFYNMSYLQANSTFSAAGGINGPSNLVDIHALRLVRVQ
jgi:hypothetical protein